MIAIIRREFREKKTSLIFYCLAILLLLWIYVALFPSLQSQAETYNKIIDTMPEAYKKAFGVTGTGLENLGSYLSIELYSLMWPVLTIFFVLARACSSFAGEIERGTIGTLLAQPISRGRLFVAKYLSSVLALVTLVVVSCIVPIGLAALFSLQLDAGAFLQLSVMAFCFGLAAFSIGLVCATIFSEKSKAYGITGALFLIMYVCNILAGIKPSLDSLKYASLFHYFNASDILSRHVFSLGPIGLFLCITIVATMFSYAWFNKRDISI